MPEFEVKESGHRELGTLAAVRRAIALTWATSRGGVVLALALTFAGALLAPLAVWLGRELVQDVVAGTPSLLAVLSLGVVSALLIAATDLAEQQGGWLGERVAATAMHRFAAHGSTLDIEQHSEAALHDQKTRAANDMWRPYWLVRSLFWLLGSGLSLVSMLVFLLFLYPVLAALALAAVIPIAIWQRHANRQISAAWRRWTTPEREAYHLRALLTDREFIKETKANGMRRALLRRHSDIVMTRADAIGRIHIRMALRSIPATVAAGAFLVAAYLVAARHLQGAAAAGLLTGAIGAIGGAITAATGMMRTLVDVERHSSFLADFFAFTSVPTALPVRSHPRPVPDPLRAGIRLDDVSFTYPNASAPALNGVSLELKPGQMVALVGANGAGKSTIVNLLLRFYDPSAGRVLIGDTDIRDVDPDGLRRRFGVLFQDFTKYQYSARENVAFGRPDDESDDEAVAAALRAARAESIVAALPDGLDTNLGWLFEGAVHLSGGQWQRLALARLIYRDAPVWILDEPTSALDAEAEQAIFTQLRDQLASRIGLVVSHRFATVRMADRIVVVEDGRILEQGSHDELMRLGGRYAELFELQAVGYR